MSTHRQDLDNARFAAMAQRWLGVQVDGWAGPRTVAAFKARTKTEHPWPARDERSLIEFYGQPGDESRLVYRPAPYPMVLAWHTSTPIRRIRCHELVADSLVRALEAIRSRFDEEARREHGLDRFGGIYNPRKMRGGKSWSTHAWGIAIDLDPLRNGLHTPWPSEAKMPVEVIEIFAAEGWLSGARAWGRDAMHFQATA